MQTLLMTKPDTADFKNIAAILGVSEAELESEWRILRRLPEDLHNQESLIRLATSQERAAMFPAFSSAVKKLLLLPVGTASVERSFSTMNRIVSSERSRLLPDHTCQLMQLTVEGIKIPDVRDSKDEEKDNFDKYINKAYTHFGFLICDGDCSSQTLTVMNMSYNC